MVPTKKNAKRCTRSIYTVRKLYTTTRTSDPIQRVKLGILSSPRAYVGVTEETRTRIEMARNAFNNYESLRDENLREDLRLDVLQCYVWSMASYASET